ncbi:hypothetical protein [Roseburia sp. 831b]|uniref:hypothetical protein n=1 Tax=Roseburia sp. 831b TaxID=1261635 RepID=UPI001179C392|nr:hypothetical protein [Roseburia sp. 831b]WVK72685.1 hypothetical protein BIV16_13235 [Roseburia sp. 831b]
MKNAKLYRAGAVCLLIAVLAGSIINQNLKKERQIARITAAVDEIGTLINICYETKITDESETDGKTGIDTEVWADFESGKWVAVYAKEDADTKEIYQSRLYDGTNSYSTTEKNSGWEKEETAAETTPNLSNLKEFYFNEDDLTNVKVKKEDGLTTIQASLTEKALEDAYQSGISSAEQSYKYYVNQDADSKDAAALLVESAKQTQMLGIDVTYTIDANGVLVQSILTQQYQSPEILSNDGEHSLGALTSHTVTYEKRVLSYNSSDAAQTIKDYIKSLED